MTTKHSLKPLIALPGKTLEETAKICRKEAQPPAHRQAQDVAAPVQAPWITHGKAHSAHEADRQPKMTRLALHASLALAEQERDQARADLQTVVDYAGKLEAQVADLLAALRDCITEGHATAVVHRQYIERRIQSINETARNAIARAEKGVQP